MTTTKPITVEIEDDSHITFYFNDPHEEILCFSEKETRIFGVNVENSPENAPRVYRALLYWFQRMSEDVDHHARFTKLELLQMEQISLLREIILRTANIVDPDCPDADAYLDGHCSLSEAVESALQKGNKNV